MQRALPRSGSRGYRDLRVTVAAGRYGSGIRTVKIEQQPAWAVPAAVVAAVATLARRVEVES